MNLFKQITIAQKIRRLLVLTSSIALLFASLVSVSIEFVSYRKNMVEQAIVFAEFISSNSTASLVFNDSSTAYNLLASLESEPTVVAATLFQADGTAFAIYSRDYFDRTNFITKIPADQTNEIYSDYNFTDLTTIKPIYLDDEYLGSILILSTFAPVYVQIMN